MEKEIVTREGIKRDNRFWLEWIRYILCIFLMSLVGPLYAFQAASSEKLKEPVLLVIIIFLICMAVISLCGLIYCIYMHIKSQSDFIIVKDVFAAMATKHSEWSANWSIYMCFKTYGNFKVKGGSLRGSLNKDFYRWAKYNHMWYEGLNRTSVPGDEFYLAMYKKRILAVYNTKLFELNKDLKVME